MRLRKLMTQRAERRRHSAILPVNWSTEDRDRLIGSGSASEHLLPAQIDQILTTWNE
ncbi:hypothetical protein PENSUB_9627 [Penicillium subrubescens]|uniref:Uncharacterized protein n=1 Tax=Penicillium subrubescens TaxID=1316194 RepID=A0A1Q5TCV7_9EURO|nr:hypothetical protein PENSUB_9627 [Penicillium subrubescens]